MKKSKVIFTLMIICLTALGNISGAREMEPLCRGVCVNEGGNQSYDQICQAATKDRCQKLANWGCVFLEREEVSGVGFCLNDPSNPNYDKNYDLSCKDERTEVSCEKLDSLGCRWIPPRLTCRLKTQ